MNIMEVIFTFQIGGSERLAANIAKKLSERGYRISVCATHSGKGPISDDLESVGIACYAIDAESKNRIKRRYDLFKTFRDNKIDVIHVHHVGIFSLVYLPARLAGVKKIVVTEHNEIDLLNNARLRRFARRTLNRVDAVTGIHKRLAGYLQTALGVAPGRLHVIYNGIDIERFRPRKPASCRACNPESFNAVFIGRLHPHKNLDMLIDAVARINRTGATPLTLDIIGTGPLQNTLVDRVHQNGIEDYVHFLGERTNIPALLPSYDFLVMSSITEGVPLVILEAMSSGLPCLATDVGGITEILPENAGIIVKPDNLEALVSGLRKMMNQERLDAFRRHVRDHVVRHFSEERMLNEYIQVLTS